MIRMVTAMLRVPLWTCLDMLLASGMSRASPDAHDLAATRRSLLHSKSVSAYSGRDDGGHRHLRFWAVAGMRRTLLGHSYGQTQYRKGMLDLGRVHFFALLFTEVDFDPLWTGPVFLRHFPFRASQAGVEGFLFTFLVVYGAVQLARSLIWAARTRKPK